MTVSQNHPFIPHVSIDSEGSRRIRLAENSGIYDDVMLDREFPALVNLGTCLGVVRWSESPDGSLKRRAYATSPAMLDYLPNPQDLIQLAVLVGSAPLNP